MIWKKVSISTTIHAVDLISEFLDEQGVEGVMIEDNQPLTEEEIKEMFVDIPLMGDKTDESAGCVYSTHEQIPQDNDEVRSFTRSPNTNESEAERKR